MPLFSDEQIEQVRQATDIVDLISRYVPLRRSGSTFKALCPFHREKTPSFHVWPETQTFKCFGCGVGGSAFHFLMEQERLTFPEAVRSLARDAGIDLGPAGGEAGGGGESREELFRVLEWACRFFQTRLRSEDGEKAVAYCKRRHIEGETARTFRLGYAPAGWRNLLDRARGRGFSVDLLERAGLIRPGDPEPYDWFRDRLVFPIRDVRGRVIAFGARALDDSEPKYLNSPDTALFKKGRTLYGLDLARTEALAARRLALVEGYTDVLMAHQHGVCFVVAALGTALTREHAALVKRYAERIVLVYDGDTAGLKAAERGVGVFLEEEAAEVRVVTLPEGEDPCDFLVERGEDAFRAALEGGREVFDFLLERATEKNDLATIAGKTAAVDFVLERVAKSPNPVVRDLLTRQAAERFGVKEESVRNRLRLFAHRKGAIETGPDPAEEDAPDDPLERVVVEACLLDPDLAASLADRWPADRFRHPVYREIARAVVGLAAEGRSFDAGAVAARIESPRAADRVAAIAAGGVGRKDLERSFRECVEKLEGRALLDETRARLARARASQDEEECRRLEREIFQLRHRVQ